MVCIYIYIHMGCISFVIYLVGYRGYVYNCVYIYIHTYNVNNIRI